MDVNTKVDRREFMRSAAISSAVLVAGVPVIGFATEEKGRKGAEGDELTPLEDLMRDHGALRRIFLIYEEGLQRFRMKKELDPALIKEAAELVQQFIHDYHEKLEEDYVFPRLKKAGRHMDMVYVLVAQHRAGEILTQRALKLSTEAHFSNPSDLAALSSALMQFIRMYRPHAAREDTTAFPEFRRLLTAQEYDRFGDLFQEKAREVFGREGFAGLLARIERIEGGLGIGELSKYSPQA